MPVPGDQSATTLAAGMSVICPDPLNVACEYVFCSTISAITRNIRQRHGKGYCGASDIGSIPLKCPTCGAYVSIDRLLQEHESWT